VGAGEKERMKSGNSGCRKTSGSEETTMTEEKGVSIYRAFTV